MGKVIKFLILYLVVAVVFSVKVGGCFSAIKRLGGVDGGDGKPGTTEIFLDVLTLPIQAIVFGPMIALELIDESTGEKGARRRAQYKKQREMDRAREILDTEFDKIFSDSRFFSVTNTPQREQFRKWLGWCNVSHLSPNQVARVVEKIMEEPSLLEPLAPICRRAGMTAGQRKWCVDMSLHLATNNVEAPLLWFLENPTITDAELERIDALNEKSEQIAMKLRESKDKWRRCAEFEWRREKVRAQKILDTDFDKVFGDSRFFSVTNTPQREQFGEWLGWHNTLPINSMQLSRIIAKIKEEPSLLEPLAPICRCAGMTEQQRKDCFDMALRLATNNRQSPIAWMLDNVNITDDEIDQVAALSTKCRLVTMKLGVLRYVRRNERRESVKRTLCIQHSDLKSALSFIENPESREYKVLDEAISHCKDRITDDTRAYLFEKMEQNPELIAKCLQIYNYDDDLPEERRSKNRAFALERAEIHHDTRILLLLLSKDETPKSFKDAVLANPRLEYCKNDIVNAIAHETTPPK